MDNNFTVIASLVTAFAAIIAPLITSIVNNIRDYKVKKLEVVYIQKLKAIEKFTEKYNYIDDDGKRHSIVPFSVSVNSLIPLCEHSETRKALTELSDMINISKCRNIETNKLFIKCLELLSKETK